MVIQPDTWSFVPGAADVKIYPIITRPSITSSNSYLLSTSKALVVIDPGASEDQTRTINNLLELALADQVRPILVVLTHCHQDHSQEVENLSKLGENAPILCVHASGADAFERQDTDLTFCSYYPWTAQICSVNEHAVRLFSENEPRPPIVALGIQLINEPLILPSGDVFEREYLQIGEEARLEFLHTPGHSECSIVIRLGDLLFTGDLPFAANPGLCGIHGWNQGALQKSIRLVTQLLEHHDSWTCLQGHGAALSRAAMLQVLSRMSNETSDRGDVGQLDNVRIQILKTHLNEVLQEASHLFTIISGQLYSLSFDLETLQENDASAEILASIDLDAIEKTFSEFRRFGSSFNSEKTPALTFVLKGVQLCSRLLLLLDESALRGLIQDSIAHRASVQLRDFLAMVRGLQFHAAETPENVNDLILGYCERINPEFGDVDLDSWLSQGDDPEAFKKHLIQQIAKNSILEDVVFELFLTPKSTLSNLGGGRFYNIFISLIEGLAASGETEIRIETLIDDGFIVLRLSGRRSVSDSSFVAERLNLYRRTMAWLGGELLFGDGTGFDMRIPALQFLEDSAHSVSADTTASTVLDEPQS